MLLLFHLTILQQGILLLLYSKRDHKPKLNTLLEYIWAFLFWYRLSLSLFSVNLSLNLGHLIDKIGKRATMTMISSILGTVSFICFYLINPLVALTVLGFCYSIFASVLWPSVALVVNKKLVGFALGIMQSFQNLTLFASPIVVAYIYSSTGSYNIVRKKSLKYRCSTILWSYALYR